MDSESIFIDVGDGNDSNEQAAPDNNVFRDTGRPPRGKKAKATKHEDPDNVDINVDTREKSSEEKKTTSNRRNIPVEILEEILLHLPVKSVLRFSSVSKSWRSIISQPRFIQRYGSAAAVSGQERILISPFCGEDSIRYWSCSLSSIRSDQSILDGTEIVSPFMGTPKIVACCEELCCVEVGESLYLWNPSMNTYKKLADSSPPPLRRGKPIPHLYGYGLGYDCVGEDYKILKLYVRKEDNEGVVQSTELYSLRKDSWRRNIELFPEDTTFPFYLVLVPGVFVSGALHWLDYMRHMIVYFDLTTEMYGEVAPPTAAPHNGSYIAVYAFRRKLCTYLNNYPINNFTLWVMEDYGVDKPWTKLLDIRIPDVLSAYYCFATLEPLYLYDNGDVLIEMMSLHHNLNMIFLYKKGDPIIKEIVFGHKTLKMRSNSGSVYVESLVSPTAAN